MNTFVMLAGVMLAIALAFVLLPMLRRRAGGAAGSQSRMFEALDDALAAGVIDQAEYAAKRAALSARVAPVGVDARAGRATRWAALAVAILLPAASILIYRVVGEPAAFDPLRMAVAAPPGAEHGIDMAEAIAGLVAKLEQDPSNADGWALLGRAYQATGQFAESRDALKRAYDLSPGNHDMTIEYAQALALAGEGRRIVGEPRDLIEGVLKADPDHQRALWLIGISDYQQERYEAAIAAWNRLLPALPPDSDIARSVRTQIADAQQRGGIAAPASPGQASTPAQASSPTATTAGPRLTVRVSVDPELAADLDPQATVFVFARAAEGPPMPLAIHRARASELPLTVTLDDSMGMMPTMKLSMFAEVIVGARISRSGDAMPKSGDLQVLSAPIEVGRTTPIDLVVDGKIP